MVLGQGHLHLGRWYLAKVTYILEDGTWPRSLTSWKMVLPAFATKEALLKKQSTCSVPHGFKQMIMESGSFQFNQPLGCGSLHPKIPKSSPHCGKGFAR